jgi:HlyD family secretion protein
MKALLTIIVLLGLMGTGGYVYVRYLHAEPPANYRIAKVERGEMLPTIGATGTIEPIEVVDIGSQVTGPITELKADWRTQVAADQVLAQIDPTKYAAIVDQAQAAVVSSSANLDLAKANLENADALLRRDVSLMQTAPGALAPSQYDIDKAAAGVARAQVGVAAAGIKQAEANLTSVQTDLNYCKIKSPVKGVIIDRRVNEGQTVVSALSASSLFLLAKDLSQVQIWASVNEADIGRIHEKQRATFTIDTFPNDVFVGEVTQVRLNATMTQNVVTYTVVVTTENKDMRLLPYMTANVNFEIEQHDDVLKVPNAALRWKPRPAQISPDVRADTLKEMNRRGDKSKSKQGNKDKGADEETSDEQSAVSPGEKAGAPATSGVAPAGNKPEDWKARAEQNGHRPRPAKPADAAHGKSAAVQINGDATTKSGAVQTKKLAVAENGPPGTPVSAKDLAKKKEHYESGYLWTADGNYVRPIKVRIIATDGTMTEVREARGGTNLQQDLEIVTGENVAVEGDETTNPFMPKFMRGGGGGGGGGGGVRPK